jgi:hypothetical protein
LAQRKHFPAINWNISFSKYIRTWALKLSEAIPVTFYFKIHIQLDRPGCPDLDDGWDMLGP